MKVNEGIGRVKLPQRTYQHLHLIKLSANVEVLVLFNLLHVDPKRLFPHVQKAKLVKKIPI